MKKIILTSGFWLLASAVSAQQFKAGISGGMVTSQVDGDTYSGYNKAGWFAGTFVTSRVFGAEKKNWEASFEITYIQKGSRKVPHPDKGDFSEYKLFLNYVEVPLLLRYYFFLSDSLNIQSGQEEQKLKFALEGGITLGRLVHSEEYDAVGQVQGGIPFKKTEVSSFLGLNYFFSNHLFFNIRSQYSVFPVREITSSVPYHQNWTYKFLKPGYYNNLIIFSLRYRF